MDLQPENYYHICNRSNNDEVVFKSPENFIYFLKKFRKYFTTDLDVLTYCLMQTHFHFLAYVKSSDPMETRKKFGFLLSSYSKAINQMYNRHGSIFQEHTKSRHIDKDSYIISLVTYIHQNPVRSRLVEHLEDWEYSSYRDYIGLRNGSLPEKDLVFSLYSSIREFKQYSETMIESIDAKYWV